jgi:hypothetical protein
MSFTLCFDSCNTFFAQSRWVRVGCVSFKILVRAGFVFGRMDLVLFDSRNRIDPGCYVLRVQACFVRINLERAGYHAVDAGFWVALELVIWWIRFLVQPDRFIHVVMFVHSSWTLNRLFSRIRLCFHE